MIVCKVQNIRVFFDRSLDNFASVFSLPELCKTTFEIDWRSLLRLSIACGLQDSKLNQQMRFSLPSIKYSDYCRALFRCLNGAQQFDYHALGSSRKLGGAAEHLIDGSENVFVGWTWNFRVRMLLKGAVKHFAPISWRKNPYHHILPKMTSIKTLFVQVKLHTQLAINWHAIKKRVWKAYANLLCRLPISHFLLEMASVSKRGQTLTLI